MCSEMACLRSAGSTLECVCVCVMSCMLVLCDNGLHHRANGFAYLPSPSGRTHSAPLSCLCIRPVCVSPQCGRCHASLTSFRYEGFEYLFKRDKQKSWGGAAPALFRSHSHGALAVISQCSRGALSRCLRAVPAGARGRSPHPAASSRVRLGDAPLADLPPVLPQASVCPIPINRLFPLVLCPL